MPGIIQFTGCEMCSLKKDWSFLKTPQMPIAPPKLNPDYKVMFIGEAPGADEDEDGIPFVGKAGKYLRDVIPGNWEKKIYWGNTIRCRPTDNGGSKNRTPLPHEIQCCSTYLERDLDIIKPQAILLLGDIALKRFWDTAWVTGMRGIPFPVKFSDGTTSWAVASFHPSYVMRQDRQDYQTKITTNTMLPVFRNDIKNFFDLVPTFANTPAKIYTPPKKEIFYPKTEQEALNLADQLKDPFAVDIETHKLKPYMRDSRIITAGFSDGVITFAFPVNWPGKVCEWGQRVFNKIMLRKKSWIAQSAAFEYSWIWDSTGSHDHDLHDIEILARLLHKRKGLGSLDDLSRIYLGVDIKKLTIIDKTKLLDYPIEKVLEYNALDAWAEYEIFNVLMQKVTDVDLENYVRLIQAIKSTVAMELKGLNVDLDVSAALQKEFYGKMQAIEDATRKVKEIIEFEAKESKIFKLSEPETVGHVLVHYCGLDLPKTPKEKQYSTSESDLQPLAGRHKLVDKILDYREVAKLLSTYIDPILSLSLHGKDGLIHPAYTVVRTATYRLSSYDPNAQNFPKRSNKEIRRQIVAPPGYYLVAFDYGQLEGRVIAMFSRDPVLKKAFVEEDDIHWKWLYRIIDLYPQYMDRLAKISGETEEKDILKSGRTIIKTDFVFASFYGSKAGSLAARTEIPLPIVERVLGEFWSEYCVTKRWVDGLFTQYQETGQVSSITGRVRNENLPGNEVVNSPCQGTAAEIVIEAQNFLFEKAMIEDVNYMPRINIHDDLVFVLPDSNDLEQYIKTIGQEIVAPRFPWINCPLMTECRLGPTWADLESVANFSGKYFE